ncbi:MAG: fasciclin domain-containing protein [Prevotellaceae bacterium]|nr:fasciclin domain-containing protein [Prevotellaceae bacterium]
MKKEILRILRNSALAAMSVCAAFMASCQDNVDDSDMYTFTGQTITSFLNDNPDEYSDYAYILSKVQLSPRSSSTIADLLSARGNYTCFAPNNEAVRHFLDSVYQTSNYDITLIPDSMAEYIARNSIIDNKNEEAYMSTSFQVGALERTNMDDRYITISFDTLSGGQTATYVNNISRIIHFDQELTNGVLHSIDHVLELSTATLPALLSRTENTRIFAHLLQITSWADSMQLYRDDYYEYNHPETGYDQNGAVAYCPEHRYIGYTAFVETDETFHEKWGIDLPIILNGIVTNIDEIVEQVARKCAEYYSNNSNDYRSQDNAVNQFISYHLLPERIALDKLVIHYAEMGYSYRNRQLTIDCFEYYETMGKQRRLIKITEGSQTNGKRINRYVTKRDLTNYSYNEADVAIPGILINEENEGSNTNALNGFFYTIDDMLLYTDDVPNKVLNERLRFDIGALLPELMTNGYRRIMSNVSVHIPSGFFQNLDIAEGSSYNYLSGYGTTWPDYQGDEHNVTGQYDMTLKLPPVPFEGTYEIRWAVPVFANRGMAQLYLGKNKQNLTPIGLPLDLRLSPSNPSIGWEADDPDNEDHNDENDKAMRNHGYMKPPMHDGVTNGGIVTESLRHTTSYSAYLRLRKIIWTGTIKPTDVLYLRIKSVLENTSTQFVMDWMELVPKNVYNGVEAEDKW